MKKQWVKLILGGIALLVAGSCGYDWYLRSRMANLYREVRAREQLSIPKQIRMCLTDGTAEGSAQGVQWLEGRLQSKQGSVAALCVLNSVLPGKIEPLPYYLERGFCGNVSRWERCRCRIRAMERHLDDVDKTIDRYFTDRNKPSLRLLPKVDWTSLIDIEGKALSSIEAKNLGFLLILQDSNADATVAPWTSAWRTSETRVRFNRRGDKYDVEAVGHPYDRTLPYQLVGTSDEAFKGKTFWLEYMIHDGDGDGLPGFAVLGGGSSPPPRSAVHLTRPVAPAWESLVVKLRVDTAPVR